MLIRICDRCGKRVKGDGVHPLLEIHRQDSVLKRALPEKHLCLECSKKLMLWLRNLEDFGV